MNGKILIIEDEAKLAAVLEDYLRLSGYRTVKLTDGCEAAATVQRENPDLLLLDLMLPGRDGLDVCRDIRAFSSVPIIITTARVEETDRLLGLELGADDYICKPYSPREVVARVKSVLRRVCPVPPPRGLSLDETCCRASLYGRDLDLTAVEFKLLFILTRQQGRIFSRSELMEAIYEDQRIVSNRTIDSHIKKLRRKVAAAAPGEDFVQSVYGAGYRFQQQGEP